MAYGLAEQYRAAKTEADQKAAPGKKRIASEAPGKKRIAIEAAGKKKSVAPDGTEYKKVRFEGEVKKWGKKQKAEVEFIDFIAANFSGNTVRVYESYKNAKGQYVYKDSNGKIHAASNGMYIDSTGDIYLDLNAGNHGEGLVMNTFAHELYHHIERESPQKARKLAEFLVQELGYENVEIAVQRQIGKAKRAGHGVDYLMKENGISHTAAERLLYDRAFSDFVADSLETMFTKGNVVKTLQKLKGQDAGLFNMIKSFIDKWVKRIRQFYRSHSTISIEGDMVSHLKKFKQIQQMFAEALVDAGENFQAAEVQKNTADNSDAKYSLRIKYSNGTTEELTDARGVTDEQILSYLEMAKRGQLYRTSYIPVRRDTPQVIIDTLHQVRENVENLSMIMQVDKARQSMADAPRAKRKQKTGDNVRKHALTPENIIEILKNLDDPNMIIFQTGRVDKAGNPLPNNVAVFVNYSVEDGEGVAVIEFNSSIDPAYIGTEIGETEYHTVVTIFRPDDIRDGVPFDYAEELLSNPNNYALEIERRPPTWGATGEIHPNTSGELSSNSKVPQTQPKVNKQFSLRESALEHYGRTYSWKETGYLLTDGSKLDFSGRREGASGGYRTVDHRDILDIYPEDTELDGNEAMVDFMKQGNIRIMPEGNGINLQVRPTKSQERALDDFISRARGEVTLDIDDNNGQTVISVEYPRFTRAAKVLQDIRNYFETGAEPVISQTAQFHYSDRDIESVSNRSLLANAFEGAAQTDMEKQKIQEYRGKIDLMNGQEQKLRKLNQQIKELSFSKGKRDTAKIRALRDEATKTANRISIYDKQLLRLESSKPLQYGFKRAKRCWQETKTPPVARKTRLGGVVI